MADVYRNEILLPRCSIGFEEPETKKLAERVDRVLSTLSEQLKAFEAAGSLTVGGIPAASVVAGSNAMYYQTFESNVHNAWNLRSGSTSGITYPNNGQAGGRALRTTNKAVWIASNVNLPLDPARLYRMRTRVRKISGTNRQVAVGVEGIGADGVTVVDRSGGTGTTTTQNLVALNATISSTTWTTYEGYFKGVAATGTATSPSTDASLPRVLHSDTKYIRPFLALSIGGDDGVYEIDYLTLEILTETSEVNKILTEVAGRSAGTIAGTIGSTGVITENNVDGTSIAGGSVSGGGGTKAHIDTGSIIATDITVTSLSAIKATLGTVNAGVLQNLAVDPTRGIRLDSTWAPTRPATWVSYIDFGATGSEPIFKFPGLEITAAGDATFSGVVSASSFTASSIVMDGSITLKLGETADLFRVYKIAADSAGIKMDTNIAGYTGFTLYNDGVSRFIIRADNAVGEQKGKLHLELPVVFDNAIYPGWIATFGANDATPSVKSSGDEVQYWKTANTSATTITNFDDAEPNQIITVFVRDNFTTFSFSGANLIGNDDVNWVATGADVLTFMYDYSSTAWRLISAHHNKWATTATPVLEGSPTTVTDFRSTGYTRIGGALDHDGSSVGLYGATPVSQSTGWEAFTSSATRKTGAANTITTEQLAQVVDTLIRQLCTLGLLSEIT